MELSRLETFREQQIERAKMLREEAKLLPPGAVRDATIRACRQANTGAYLNEWANSAGLKQPT